MRINGMQRTALRAAADAERWADKIRESAAKGTKVDEMGPLPVVGELP